MRRQLPFGVYAITFDPVMQKRLKRRQRQRKLQAVTRFLVGIFVASVVFAICVMAWRGY